MFLIQLIINRMLVLVACQWVELVFLLVIYIDQVNDKPLIQRQLVGDHAAVASTWIALRAHNRHLCVASQIG